MEDRTYGRITNAAFVLVILTALLYDAIPGFSALFLAIGGLTVAIAVASYFRVAFARLDSNSDTVVQHEFFGR